MGSFNVNVSNVQPAARGLPPDEYIFRVAEIDHAPAKNSTVAGLIRTNVRCEVLHNLKGDVTLQGKSMWHGFNENDQGAPYFVAFIGALGITQAEILSNQYNGIPKHPGQVIDEMLVGRTFVGRVYTNNQGYTNIGGERPVDSSVQTPQGQQPIGAPPAGGGFLQQPAGFGQPPQGQMPQQPPMQQGGFPQQASPMQQPQPAWGQQQMQPQPAWGQQQMQPQPQPGNGNGGFPQMQPGQQAPQAQPQGGYQQGYQQPQQGQPLPAPAPPPGNVGQQGPWNR